MDAIMASRQRRNWIGETARETVNQSVQMQTFLKSVNLPGGFTDYVISEWKITTIISASGVQILLFLAGLQSVTPSPIGSRPHGRGANSWEIFWKITVSDQSSHPVVSFSPVYHYRFLHHNSIRYPGGTGKYTALQFRNIGSATAVYSGGFLIIARVYGHCPKSGVLSR